MVKLAQSAKTLLGVLARDWWRYRRALSSPSGAYLGLCNRNERLELAPDNSGYRCDWRWTSELHAPKHLPSLGLRLLRRAMSEHEFRSRRSPAASGSTPDVTFLIGHRGTARLPHLMATIRSIASQQGVNLECIVIEQAFESQVKAHLPEWVRYVHTPPAMPEMPYCRAWTFNVGARHARGRMLILHDNDMLVPADYAREILRRADQGFDVINPKRYIFYLSEEHTQDVFEGTAPLDQAPPACIVQNLEAGGSVAISRRAYLLIGGMDEAFVGWGGEDNEFWERAQTLRVWPYGSMPLVHLWHAPQPEKLDRKPATIEYYRRRSDVPVERRVRELQARDFGNAAQTDPRWSPRSADC